MNTHPMNLSQRLAVRDSVTHLLEESPTLEAAARGAPQTVCESLTWEWGALWVVGPGEDALICVETLARADVPVPRWEPSLPRQAPPSRPPATTRPSRS